MNERATSSGEAYAAEVGGDRRGSRYQWYVALTATSGFAFATMDNAFFTQALTPLSRDLGLDVSAVGLLTSIIYLVAGVSTYVVGWAMDRVGRRRAFQGTLLGTALGSVLTALSWGFAPLVVFRAVSNGSASAEGVAGQTLVAENSVPQRRGFLMAVQQVGYPIGWFLSAGLALAILPVLGWRALFVVGVVPAILALAARRWIRESDRFIDLRNARKLASAGEAADTTRYGVDVHRARESSLRQLFAHDLRRTTVLLFLATFCLAIGSGAVLLFIPYLVEARGLPNSALNTIIAIGTAGGVIGYLAQGRAGDQWGRKWTIVVSLVLGSIAIYLLAASTTFTSMLVFEIFFWVFYMGAYAALYGFITESFPTRVRGAGTGLVTSAIWLAHVGTGLLVPVIVLEAGIEWAFVLTGSLAGLVSVVLFTLCRNVPQCAAGRRARGDRAVSVTENRRPRHLPATHHWPGAGDRPLPAHQVGAVRHLRLIQPSARETLDGRMRALLFDEPTDAAAGEHPCCAVLRGAAGFGLLFSTRDLVPGTAAGPASVLRLRRS